MTGRPAARIPLPRSFALRALLWLAALGALLFFVRDQLGPVLTLIAGILVFASGAGFVAAPLIRRHAGSPAAGDDRLLHRRSFVVGCLLVAVGMAVAGYGLYRVIEHAVSVSHAAFAIRP